MQTRTERYETPRVHDNDEDDETEEKQEVRAEQLVEQLKECEDADAHVNKRNPPPEAGGSLTWDSDCRIVWRMAEKESRRLQGQQRQVCKALSWYGW